jgi:hypothetical protein
MKSVSLTSAGCAGRVETTHWSVEFGCWTRTRPLSVCRYWMWWRFQIWWPV